MPKLILDSSIVICWCEELEDKVVFEKLCEAGYEPVIPQKVADEVQSDNYIAEEILESSEIICCDEERYEELSNRLFRLGSGEKAVLALGQEFESEGGQYFCVLDDGRAREACERLNLEMKGTIGLLGDLVSENLMEFRRADELIQEMKDNGTRLPENHTELLNSIT